MKKNSYKSISLILCSFFLSFVINAQTIDYTVTGSLCAGTHTLTLSGTANGKNTYTGSIVGNTATISWSGTQWQINTPFGIQFTNSAVTALDPPCHNVGTFISLGFCSGATVTNSTGACATAVIPVELVDFSARASTNSVELTWLTASETNNKGFQIERSEDGVHFNPIDFVKSQSNSHGLTRYKLVDKNTFSGVDYYYRLNQIDNDGKEKLSKTISVKASVTRGFTFAPNPANSIVTIHFGGEKATFRVYNMLGQLVLNTLVCENNNAQTMDISALHSGNYILEMTTNGAVFREKLVKF